MVNALLVAVKEKKLKKRRVKFLLFAVGLLVTLVFIAVLNCGVATAATETKSEEEIRKGLEEGTLDVIDGLDLSALQAFLDKLNEEQKSVLEISDVKEALKLLVDGNSGGFFKKIMSILASTVGRYFVGFLPSFITLIIICLLNGILMGMTSDFLNGGTSEVVRLVCYCACICVLAAGVGVVLKSVTDTLNLINDFSAVIFPILLTLLSILGGSVTASAYTPYLAVLSGVIMKIVTVVIVPAFVACIVFSIVGNLSKTVKLEKLVKVVKSSSSWLIGIMFGLFATFLTVQGVTGGVIDKFGFNIAKFAISSYVPVLGGYLSDGFDIVSASLVIVKNAVGYFACAVLVAIVLFPLIKTVIFSLTLRLAAAIVEPIGDKRTADVLSTVADSMGLLITVLVGVAFLFYLILMLFAGSCNMGL